MFALEQVISREHPALVCSAMRLSVGRDGRVYLVDSQPVGPVTFNYILRMAGDGGDRHGVAYQAGGDTPLSVTANSAGYVARGDAHFAGAVTVLDEDLHTDPVGQWIGCYVSDAVAYNSPFRVEAGAVSGRFYALAQHGLSKPGHPQELSDPTPSVVAVGSPPDPVAMITPTYPLTFATGAKAVLDFRVRETGSAADFVPEFYVLYTAVADGLPHIAKIDVSGAKVWDRTDPAIQKLPRDEYTRSGGFDVDEAGNLYVVEPQGAAVYRYPDDGAGPRAELPLAGAFPSPVGAPYRELRVLPGQLVLQRQQSRELYATFELPDPSVPSPAVAFQQSVWSQHDLVRAEFVDEVADQAWTAGSTVRVRLTVDRFMAQQGPMPAPDWRAWLRSIGGQDHRELALTPDAAGPTLFRLAVPADLSGLAQLTLAPETGPYRISAAPEYRLRRIVEIRPQGATGSVSLGTVAHAVIGFLNGPAGYEHTLNRTRYAAGEPVTVTVSVRPAPTAATDLVLRLDDITGGAPVTVARGTVSVPATAAPQLTVTVPAAVTGRLRPGRYLLTADAPGRTVAGQPIELGSGAPPSGYRRVWFGDYGELFPATAGQSNSAFTADGWDAADVTAAHLERVRRQGWTIVVDRLALQLGNAVVYPPEWDTQVLGPVKARLDRDPVAVDSMKLWRLPPVLDTVSGFGATGVQQRAILTGNDANVPLLEQNDTRANYDGRRPIDRYNDLFQTNTVFSGYRAFGGWHWAANWWLNEHSAGALPHGLFGPKDGPYPAELAKTEQDGRWRPLLAAMLAHALSHQPDVQRQLRRVLAAGAEAGAGAAAPVTSATGPFRAAFVYPPESFSQVDEVDMQAQMEQFPLWLHTAFSVDFYPRPGKPSTLHEENWNDNGTGDQVLGQALLALMRGSATSGHSARVPTTRQTEQLPDARSLVHGTASMYRVLAELLHEYGEWISRFDSADRVAILLSRRQFGLEQWYTYIPNHFVRVFEAYVALLYAQIPASLVFVEDLQAPGARPLSDYAAVLLVHERVECEQAVVKALAGARRVFHDGACASVVTDAVGSTPLNVTFDLADDGSFAQFNADAGIQSTNPNRPSAPSPVAKSWRSISLAHVPALRAALADLVGADRPTADDPEVLVSERVKGDARLVVAVNNSLFDVDNAIFRRAENHSTVRPPVATTLNLPGASGMTAVYDVLGGTRVTPSPRGQVPVDFRHWPVAVHAVLSAPISAVVVAAAPVVSAQPGGPVEVEWSVRVLGGSVGAPDLDLPVRVRFLDAGGAVLRESHLIAPAGGGYLVPANAQGAIRVEAVELISGRGGAADAGVSSGPTPIDLLSADDGSAAAAAGPTTATDSGPGPAVTDPVPRTAADPRSNTAAVPGPAPAVATPNASLVTPWQPAVTRLGAHLREIALTGDGGAVLTAANWDTNLYAIDLATGQQRWQTRIGHQYAYGPQPVAGAVAVRGMALDTPSGFGLHLVNAGSGAVERRFDLYGTTPRWFHRVTSVLADGRPPAFAAPPSGSWVAAAGNLGLAVWRRTDGAELWHEDWWSQAPLAERPGAGAEVLLTALDEDAVLVVQRDLVTAYQVSTGAERWHRSLASAVTTPGGQVTRATLSPDGTLVALTTTYDSGRVFLLRTADGALAAALTASADELAWGPDSRSLVTLRDTRLDQYRDTDGTGTGWALRRSYPAADVLHNLDIAADGRIACGDEQGNLVVLTADAEPELVTDVVGIPAVRWLPGGDLLVATWLGRASRLNGTTYQPTWATRLRSTASDMRGDLLVAQTAPVSRIAVTGNATTPPVTGLANLLPATTTISFFTSAGPGGSTTLDATKLLAPDPVPPQAPLLPDQTVEVTAEGFPLCYLLVQSHRSSPLTFDRITLWDDPAHPEAWLRDLRLDARTAPDDPWQPVLRLISDAAARTHQLPRTTATDIRLVVPPGIPGNLRLAGIALYAS